MKMTYIKAIAVGVAGVFIQILLIWSLSQIVAGMIDDDPATDDFGAGMAGIFGMIFIFLFSMVFTGILSVIILRKEISGILDALTFSSLSGIIPALLIMLIIMIFQFMTGTYGPPENYSNITTFDFIAGVLSKALTIQSLLTFVLTISLSIMGGIVAFGVLRLYDKIRTVKKVKD